MKKFALAVAGLAALFAVKPAAALPYVYDTFTPVVPVGYTTAVGGNFMGDVLIPTAPGAICRVAGTFVATAAGTYTVDVLFFNSRCLGGVAPAPCIVPAAQYTFTVNIVAPTPPATLPAVYDVQFPINPNFTWAPVAPETIVGIAFRVRETGLYPTAANVAPAVGTGFNGFSLDTNPNDQCLTPAFAGCAAAPPGPEWFNFTATPAWTNGNMVVGAEINCTPPPVAEVFRGPSVQNVATVELSQRTALHMKSLLPLVAADIYKN